MEGLHQYDHLPAAEAARRAWTHYGVRPVWHLLAQETVRNAMPVLARALDRLEGGEDR